MYDYHNRVLRPESRTSRRYDRLIGMLIHHDMLDLSRLEKRAIHRRVVELTRRYRRKCVAMDMVAKEMCCSYQKVDRKSVV